MSLISRKRILIDIKNFRSEKITGIYAYFDDSDIYKAKALIIGPSETPYENGCYLFDIEFPKSYPLHPPKVLFRTLDNRIRFNPNLYKCGKVCVSILGTWAGPGWTSVMTLTNVLVSLQSLLNSKPIQNEPGWENENGTRCKAYNQIIEYYNYEVAILNMFKKQPNTFECFKEEIEDHISQNIDNFISVAQNNLSLDNIFIKSHIYGLNLKPNYKYLLNEFKEIKKNLSKKSKKIESLELASNLEEHNQKLEDGPKKRKCPNKSSKELEIGTIMKSDNDNNDWIVCKFGNSKRWVKKIK